VALTVGDFDEAFVDVIALWVTGDHFGRGDLEVLALVFGHGGSDVPGHDDHVASEVGAGNVEIG
jgi:hypothetical protein